MANIDNSNNQVKRNKPKVFTIINYIIAALSIIAFVIYIIGAIDAYTPNSGSSTDISGSGALALVFIFYSACGFILPFIIGIVTSLINLRFDKKQALITLLINAILFLILVAIFVFAVISNN